MTNPTYGKPPFHRLPLAPELAPPRQEGPSIRTIQEARQAAFERGVLLALTTICLDSVGQMQGLASGPGGKWVLTHTDLDDLEKILRRMHEGLLRTERLTWP